MLKNVVGINSGEGKKCRKKWGIGRGETDVLA